MKKYKVIFWIATIIIVLWEGVMPLVTILISKENATLGTRPLGYPDYFAYALIVCKILGTIGISVPSVPYKLKEWAYAGLSFNLIFAFISHAYVDKNIGYMLMPLFFFVVLMISYRYNPQLKRNVNP